MGTGSDEPAAVMQSILSKPAVASGMVPRLFEFLASDRPRTRLQGAWGICLAVDTDPERLEPVIERLIEQLQPEEGDEQPAFEAELVFSYLRYRFPERVGDAVSTVEREAAIEDVRASAHEGGFARSDYSGVNEGPSTVGEAHPTASEGPASVVENTDPEPPEDGETAELLESEQTAKTERERAHHRQWKLDELAEQAGLTEIAEGSRFDELQLLEPGSDGRYATIYRTRAIKNSTEAGIAINVLQTPETDHETFAVDVTEQLENWEAVADSEAVVSVHDWSMEPFPWVATAYTDQSLYDLTDFTPARAVSHALTIAEALSYAHQRGIVHAGIDPYVIGFTDGAVANRQRPLLGNVGLVNAMRRYFDPSSLLDPRYAAPEYYSSDYGDIDHKTDIYQFGGVMYTLLTGRPPFTGGYSEIRADVLNSQPPAPSEIDDGIPAALDDVIYKAMATQKLARYETVTQLMNELKRL